MNIFDTGYTLEGEPLYLARRDHILEAARARSAIAPDGWIQITRTTFALDEELEALLTGALPSEVEG